MIYDRDLRWHRRLIYALLAANVLMLFESVRRNSWLIAAFCLIWAANVANTLWLTRSEQRLRDEMKRWR